MGDTEAMAQERVNNAALTQRAFLRALLALEEGDPSLLYALMDMAQEAPRVRGSLTPAAWRPRANAGPDRR